MAKLTTPCHCLLHPTGPIRCRTEKKCSANSCWQANFVVDVCQLSEGEKGEFLLCTEGRFTNGHCWWWSKPGSLHLFLPMRLIPIFFSINNVFSSQVHPPRTLETIAGISQFPASRGSSCLSSEPAGQDTSNKSFSCRPLSDRFPPPHPQCQIKTLGGGGGYALGAVACCSPNRRELGGP